jgi:hypothetical protein
VPGTCLARAWHLHDTSLAGVLLGISVEVTVGLLLALVIALLILSLPTWPYSAAWGYYPSSGLGILLLIVVVLLLSRRRV